VIKILFSKVYEENQKLGLNHFSPKEFFRQVHRARTPIAHKDDLVQLQAEKQLRGIFLSAGPIFDPERGVDKMVFEIKKAGFVVLSTFSCNE